MTDHDWKFYVYMRVRGWVYNDRLGLWTPAKRRRRWGRRTP